MSVLFLYNHLMKLFPSSLLEIAVPAPLRRYFHYLCPVEYDHALFKPGMRVRVPFQRRELVGIFMGFKTETDVSLQKLKPIIEILDKEPLISEEILTLCRWAADYYHYPIGEVLLSALPGLLRQGKPAIVLRPKPLLIVEETKNCLSLNSAQAAVMAEVRLAVNRFQTFLLEGVTGSGKTEVYLQIIADVLARGQQALVLVPEIGLTPQTLARFRERFAFPVVTMHSAMTEKQKLQAWLAAQSGEAKIVIGTRSAIFMPFANLGFIVIDEEHDLSFKQQEGFRYHARDVAIMRAHLQNIPILLGSATPSLESLHNAKQQRFKHLQLLERAGNANMPQFEMVDIRRLPLEEGLSPILLAKIKDHLQAGEQVMLFLNRRGFAPVLICHACGTVAMCKRCDARLTYHHETARLHCHHCETQKKIIDCEQCKATELYPIGHGTERLEMILAKYFPEYAIARIDKDNMRRRGSLEKTLLGIQNGDYQLIIGTQMLAKGHHFPQVTLVAIVDADGGFFSTDFRALERMGQLLLQVAGRAGRHEKKGTVMIQTRHPHHLLLQQLIKEDYQSFASALLQERAQTYLPPYTFFALIRAEAHDENHAKIFLQQVKNYLDSKSKNIETVGPFRAPMARRAGLYRMHLLLQANKRSHLQSLLKLFLSEVDHMSNKQRVRWSLDVDPLEMA